MMPSSITIEIFPPSRKGSARIDVFQACLLAR
jgi:hypothetical protein